MRDVQAQVVAIETNTTRSGKTRYDIKLSSGEQVTAWELALATKASQSGGQVITARIEDKTGNNGAVYHNLKELALAGEQLAPIVAQPGTPVAFGTPIPVGGGVPIQQGGGAPAASGSGSGGMSAEDKVRITKLSCISSACALFSGTGEVDQALEVAQTIYRAVMPQAVQAPADPAPVQLPDPAAAMAAAQDAAGIAAAAAAAGTPIQLGTGVQPAAEPAALPWATS